jgi:lysyl-tRNA synthetase class I
VSDQADQAPATELPEGVSAEDAINRGKGLTLEAIPAGSEAEKAIEDFKEFAAAYKEAEDAFEAKQQERMHRVYDLKETHNIGFSALAEVLGVTSSMTLYLYERAQGKSAKQIREESVASRKAKEATRVVDPNKPPARKQTPEERAFRKQQREALRAFLEEQKRLAAERGEDTAEQDQGLADVAAEDAADADEDT